jgi:hypothetical protein
LADIDRANLPSHDDDHDGSPESGKRLYEVGYGKPPTATRFRKGQSGNPRGPKKGSRGLKKDLHKALGAPHSIKVDGKVRKGTTQELAVFTLAKRAATGDVRATSALIDLTLKIFGAEDRGRERGTLSPLDQELFDRMFDRVDPAEEAGASHDGDSDDDAGAGDGGGGGFGDDEIDNTEHSVG